MSAGTEFSRRWDGVAKICHGREATIALYGQPGAASLLIASAKRVGAVRPPIGVPCRPRMKFVAIAGNNQRVFRADPMCDDEQTDSSASGRFDPVIDQSPRD